MVIVVASNTVTLTRPPALPARLPVHVEVFRSKRLEALLVVRNSEVSDDPALALFGYVHQAVFPRLDRSFTGGSTRSISMRWITEGSQPRTVLFPAESYP